MPKEYFKGGDPYEFTKRGETLTGIYLNSFGSATEGPVTYHDLVYYDGIIYGVNEKTGVPEYTTTLLNSLNKYEDG